MPQTLYDKIWKDHIVHQQDDGTTLLYVDRHLIHEVTSPQAFEGLRLSKRRVRKPDLTLAVADHNVPTTDRSKGIDDQESKIQVETLEKNCKEFGIELFDMKDKRQGIVHIIGPEQGFTQPGTVIVCGDSHTATHGAFGALAFGIGTTEVAHVLATQCLLQRKPKTLAVNLNGRLDKGVSAKDIILKIIGQIGVDGGTGHAIEYRGDTVAYLTLEQRMTICNMSIEAGARAGLFAPDQATIEYLHGRPMSPKGVEWDRALKVWKELKTDAAALFNQEVDIDVAALTPMITFGTNPGMVMPIESIIPDHKGNQSFKKALDYMKFESGKPLLNHPIDVVFIGSCTNSRLSDLRDAAKILKGRKVAENIRVMIVPGSQSVKTEAEAEGLDKIFKEAGAEWRESGCSMCIGMNGDTVGSGKLAVSTSNRNFEGRQGSGSRTILASPKTAAASAITGSVQDPRKFEN